MRSNPVNPKFVLVTGRRSELETDDKKRSLVRSQEREDFKIISYDSLIEGYPSNQPIYVAARNNSHIDILSDSFVGESVFVWVAPERLRISQTLYHDAIANKNSWCHVAAPGKSGAAFGTLALDVALPKIAIRGE